MKHTILSVFFALALIVNAKAIDKNKNLNRETNASYFAQNNFEAKYHDAKNVVWSNVDGYYKAAFTLNGVKKSAFFNAQGEYVATTEYISGEKLPAKSLEKLKKLYKDYTLGEVLQFEVDDTAGAGAYTSSSDNMYYFASLRKEDSQIVVKITAQNDVSFFRSL
ncbi:hypothetical protein [Desertivirga xinjiangensis]|uniref:hypothetical protein n=1 Tax=Desertivirga xinjiangensis TaxID=539206 RepID=UPI00210CB2FF|nr:hypothetical protein [Pedobacter xinjiangensis]